MGPTLPAKALVTRSMRVRNDGNFCWRSDPPNPIQLSYHWLRQDGSMAIFEGIRTSLPVSIVGGREITIPMSIATPPQPGAYVLKVMLIHEGVKWAEETGCSIPIQIVESLPESSCRAYTKEELPDWDPAADSSIAVEMITAAMMERFYSRRVDILEIGGGSSPETLALMDRLPDWSIRCLNLDVSYSLLRLCSLHLRYTRPETVSLLFVFVRRCQYVAA